MNLVLEYIQYLWKANLKSTDTNETAAKIKNCITSSTSNLAYENELKVFRNIAKRQNRKIQVKDFGAGSKKMGFERSIQSIYKNSRSSLKYQRILFKLVKEFQCDSVLEMGTSLGFTTVYLSNAVKTGKVTTIEACQETANEAKSLFQEMKLENVVLVNSTFSDFFEKNPEQTFDFVFVDGHHDGKALLEYMEILLKRCKSGCIFVLDDIRWSGSMYDAWKELIQKSEFDFHFDLFRMGILVYKN
jgi:predicted O-methyltransferase YrrM